MTIWRNALISCFLAGSATVLLSLGACTTLSLEDAFPAAVQTSPPPEPQVFSSPGDYPNLNITPQPSGPQLTNEESRAAVDDLREKRARQATGGGQAVSPASADELR